MKVPRVGIGVLVIHNNQLLLGKRIHSHGLGTWCPPGGHLEFGETPTECAIRELREETGLSALEVVEGPWSNDYFEKEEKHYLTVFMLVKSFEGKLIVAEPDKCSQWEWFDLNALPAPLFLSLHHLLEKSSLKSLY